MKKRIIALIAAVCMLAAFPTGCSDEPAESNEAAEISIFAPDGGRIFLEDDPVIAEIEKKTGTKITANLATPETLLSDFSILVASGEVPDIVQLTGFDFFQFVNQGIFMELDELVENYGQNIKKAVGEEQEAAWELLKDDGKLYAIPRVTSAGKFLIAAREDWMDNLGIQPPQTLDEYVSMLRRFTTDDPDGNGKNDTFGLGYNAAGANGEYVNMFAPIFGAYGFQPDKFVIKGDKVVSTSVSDEYREAIKLIKELYEEKVIDPEIFIQKGDQALQKLVTSRVGSSIGWWSMVPNTIMEQWKMSEINPDARWQILPAPKGADGKQGLPAVPEIQCTTSISSEAKHPEAAIKLLDYLATDEGFRLANEGFAGVHYDPETGAVTEEGQKGLNEKWIGALGAIVSNISFQEANWEKNTPDKWVYIKAAKEMPLYHNDMYTVVTNEYNMTYPELNKLQEEWFIKFVTGEESIDNYDKYIEEWKQKGGLKMLESMVKVYNERNNTNLKAAIK